MQENLQIESKVKLHASFYYKHYFYYSQANVSNDGDIVMKDSPAYGSVVRTQ